MVEGIEIYTDGGCSGNPGPGAWAYVMVSGGEEREGSGNEMATTNNRMELTAVIRALEALGPPPCGKVTVHTDSQYVKNGITGWIISWKRNGWKTADKKPVKNRELWERLDELASALKPDFKWVKGHAGHHYNERCDALVRAKTAELVR